MIGWEQLFTGFTNRCLILCQPAEINAAGTQPSLCLCVCTSYTTWLWTDDLLCVKWDVESSSLDNNINIFNNKWEHKTEQLGRNSKVTDKLWLKALLAGAITVHSVVASSGELRGKGRHGVLCSVRTVWSMHERFRGEFTTKRYTNSHLYLYLKMSYFAMLKSEKMILDLPDPDPDLSKNVTTFSLGKIYPLT